ncbi:heme o synthase [sulfur-oxidizing endosymbiont of Gigantopelta aegis]|uniref:heme o synthase n=1 Tax=sulfur-oxidizing endosymbiont of Gigantopelta aegis TaxID=2794934 RepID=UPI0018DBDBF2|nr:heme o synthase [sulfur-oxidizing endosymbiont of Gigantopelta aegis]
MEIASQIPFSTIAKAYLETTKPKVVALLVFTAIVGMLLASPGALPVDIFIFASLGIALASASGAAINHVVDQYIDAQMGRTKGRPLPTGVLTAKSVLIFALSLGALSMVILSYTVNVLTALLALIALIGYAVIYTMYLKRHTPHNIVLGGAAGAMPPVLGWTSVTGEINSEALLLFLIIFIWTPPHFWALAIKRKNDYAKAGLPMLPVTHGINFTKLQILLYTFMLLAVSIFPFVTQMSGLIYLSGAISLGIGFIFHAFRLYRTEGDMYAMKTFAYSILYLGLLFAFLLTDHYVRVIYHSMN